MNVRLYTPNDFEMIQGWLTDRETPGFTKDLLPPFGQVVDDVAAGFIIETDTNFAFLDYYVTNPKASLSDRIRATNTMLERAVERIESRGNRYVVAFSKSRGGVRYSRRFGFSMDETPYFIFRKVLSPVVETNFCVRPYEEKDFDMIRPWLCSEALDWVGKTSLPKTGFVVDDYGCLFIIQTDSKIAVLDCFATNKSEAISDRIEAADILCRHVQNHAIDLGCQVMLGNTRSAKGLSLFTRHGFKYDPDPYFFIRKRLGLQPDRQPVDEWQRALCL